MFQKICKKYRDKDAIIIYPSFPYSLSDTLECGQAFRYERILREGDYKEYLTVVEDTLVFVAQDGEGAVIFYTTDEKAVDNLLIPYFSLDEDYERINTEISNAQKSEWLRHAAEASRGIRILKQSPFEALISFIISQNNNIPRIRKIIRSISAQYGKNLAECHGVCPKSGEKISTDACGACGICYSFPKAEDIMKNPEGLLPAKLGFRYGYILDAVEKVISGEVNLEEIKKRENLDYTLSELKKIRGVGDKVASCVALFSLGNLDAFPIDVWMRRAIDTYFDGSLDITPFQKYAGIAQQYIFHYIRNIENRQ